MNAVTPLEPDEKVYAEEVIELACRQQEALHAVFVAAHSLDDVEPQLVKSTLELIHREMRSIYDELAEIAERLKAEGRS